MEILIDNHNGPIRLIEIRENTDDRLILTADYPEDAREFLKLNNVDTVLIDVDGNNSIVRIPSDWIGDGSPLFGSDRVMSLIR